MAPPCPRAPEAVVTTPDDGNDDSMPNYGDRLRRARMGLAIALTPILVLFISFTRRILSGVASLVLM